MKNHYIPQFIQKQYSERINVFDLETGEYYKNKRRDKTFFGKEIYSDEVEHKLNEKVERPFNDLLSQKILPSKDKVVLNRVENTLVRKYLMIFILRTQIFKNSIRKIFSQIEKFSNIYFDFIKNYYHLSSKNIIGLKDLKADNKELINICLEVLCDCNSASEIFNHKLAFKELISFYYICDQSYLAFWGTPDNTEYILSDNGYITDIEYSYHLTNSNLNLKAAYLLHLIKNEESNKTKFLAGVYLAFNGLFDNNFMIFNLSKNLSLVLIHPLFKNFFPGSQRFLIGEEYASFPIPDIWPSILENRDIFEPCTCDYKISSKLKTQSDEFIYKIKALSKDEVNYINFLSISESRKEFAFDNIEHVKESIYLIFSFDVQSKVNVEVDKMIKMAGGDERANPENYSGMLDLMYEITAKNSKFYHLFYDGELKFEVDRFEQLDYKLMDVLHNQGKLFENNFYLFEYLYNNIDNVLRNNYFDFISKGNHSKLKKDITDTYQRLLKERNSK